MIDLYDLELERAVLGSVVMRPKLMLTMGLSEGEFYGESHRLIWRSLQRLTADNEPINTSTLRADLADIGKLGAIGGDDYLLSLTDTIPDEHLPTERLRRLARLRGVKEAAGRLVQECATGDLERALAALADATAASHAGAPRNATEDVLELCESLLEEMANPVDRSRLIHPGYELLRNGLGLIPRQTTVGILADTNVGKSTYLLETLSRMARRGTPTGYLSVEDQRPRVRARIAGMLTGVSSRKILQHDLTREELTKLAHGFNEIVPLKKNFHVAILQGGTDADVCAAMSELAQRGCVAIGIDYLQKITPSTKNRNNKAHEVADIATRITAHGQRLDAITFLLSQCTRDKQRQNECPSKHDMKESGDLENMLDAIIGLWREYEGDDSPTWARLLKTKDGGLGGSWCLQRSQETGRFDEVPGSDQMKPPDGRGEWTHRKQGGR